MGLQIPVLHEQDSAGQVEVNEAIFGQSFNETLIHQLVTRYQAQKHKKLARM
jgi:large subunit ribosomal protein L4